jgi:hypothetical protein
LQQQVVSAFAFDTIEAFELHLATSFIGSPCIKVTTHLK